MSANNDLFDATLRHGIAVRRYTLGEVQAVLDLLNRSNAELTAMLNERLVQGDFTSKRYRALLKDIQAMRRQLWTTVFTQQQQRLSDLADVELAINQSMVDGALGFELSYAAVDAARLQIIVNARPFAGGANAARTLEQWWMGLSAVDQARITEAIAMGMTNSETVDQMVRRVRQNMDLTRRNAEAVVRTSVSHISNQTRNVFFEANQDLARVLRWTSTLDGRTSLICAGRDGHYAPVVGKDTTGVPMPWLKPLTARPPAHPNCRSVMVAILDPDRIEELMPARPFVRDTRTRRQREIDFRAQAKAEAGPAWRNMTEQQRNAMIKDIRRQWTAEHVGTVPGVTTYDEWLRRQSREFQDSVLGPGRAKLFREGLRLDQYVDRAGDTLTLDELQALI